MITYHNMGRLGRLGNALFQIASTIGIARANNQEVIFPADWTHRKFFSIPDKLFGDIPPDAVEATDYIHHMDERATPYMQDISLFWPYMDEIRNYFQPSEFARSVLVHEPAMPQGFRICVHVRLDDKVNDPGTPDIDQYFIQPQMSWYLDGLTELIKSKLQTVRVCCFSDDLLTAEKYIPADYYGEGTPYLKNHEPGFMEGTPLDWIDFFQMARCDAFVISGSTMAIWAAILAQPDPKHVLRPAVVYGPQLSFVDSELLFPPDWQVR